MRSSTQGRASRSSSTGRTTSGTGTDHVALTRRRHDPGHRRRRLHRLPRRRRAARARRARSGPSTRCCPPRTASGPDYLDPRAELDRGRPARRGGRRARRRGRRRRLPPGGDGRPRGRHLATSPTTSATTTSARRVLLRALARRGFGGRFVLASSMVVYGEGRYACPEHGIVRPGPRAPEALDAGQFEPPCPVCGRALEPRAGARGRAAGPAQRLRRHQGRPGAPVRRRLARDRRAGDRAALPQRLRPADAARHALRRAWRASSAPRSPPATRRSVFEDGGQRRDFVHVRDVARANVLALTAPEPVPGAFNVASGTPRTVLDMAQALARAFDGAPEPQVTGQWRARRRPPRVRLGRARPRSGSASARREDFEAGMREFASAPAARMTRVAVVGHVEWMEFARVPRLPAPGEIVHATEAGRRRAAAARSPRSSSPSSAAARDFFTALGDDERGAAAPRSGSRRSACGCTRRRATSRSAAASPHIDADGERTITVIGERIVPHGADPLPWELLDAIDGVYFTGGDADALRAARRARRAGGDAARRRDAAARPACGSTRSCAAASDPGEQLDPARLDPPPRYVVDHRGRARRDLGGRRRRRRTWKAGAAAGAAARRLRRRRLVRRRARLRARRRPRDRRRVRAGRARRARTSSPAAPRSRTSSRPA